MALTKQLEVGEKSGESTNNTPLRNFIRVDHHIKIDG